METLKHNPCYHCGGAVQVRKPSATGLHFCRAKACQNAKQRKYRQLAAERSAKTSIEITTDVRAVELEFVAALVRGSWEACSRCGANPVLRDWVHRRPDGNGGCVGLGAGRGTNLGSLDVLDAAMPHLLQREPLAPPTPAGPVESLHDGPGDPARLETEG